MKQLSRREVMVITESTPFTNFAKSTLGLAGKAIGKAAGVAGRAGVELAKAHVPYDTSDFVRRSAQMGKKIWQGKGKGVNDKRKLIEDPQVRQTIRRYEGRIQRLMALKKVKSTPVSKLPTLAPGKASNKFAMIDPSGKVIYVFYPYSKTGKPNSDKAFFVWDGIKRKVEEIQQPLRNSKFVKQPEFVTLQNLEGTGLEAQRAANIRPRSR
jgi:hypothetical protein